MDKQYSCAYLRSDDDTLARVQAHKKQIIARKLRIEPGMEVLDNGCGWGGMALALARDCWARVTGMTPLRERHAVATARAEEAGLSDRVTFELRDYRTLDRSFDRIVSVGMFEHVGVPQYDPCFGCIRDLLRVDGVALVRTIGRPTPPGSTSPWVARYIFPVGCVPALSQMSAASERQDLHLTDLEVWRLHCARTLAHWERRFVSNIDRVREIYDDRFCRMWRYDLIVCELTFVHGAQVVFQTQLSHRKDAVPITRDYLCDA